MFENKFFLNQRIVAKRILGQSNRVVRRQEWQDYARVRSFQESVTVFRKCACFIHLCVAFISQLACRCSHIFPLSHLSILIRSRILCNSKIPYYVIGQSNPLFYDKIRWESCRTQVTSGKCTKISGNFDIDWSSIWVEFIDFALNKNKWNNDCGKIQIFILITIKFH